MSCSPGSTGASAVHETAPFSLAHSRSRVRLGRTHTGGGIRSLRGMIILATACAGSGLLVAACSAGSTSGSAGTAAGASGRQAAAEPRAANGPAFGTTSGHGTVTTLTKLAPIQDIIYIANLTLRVKDVNGAATSATNDVTGVGGYLANEQQTQPTGRGSVGQVDMQLKIPVAVYHQTLAKLATLGVHVMFSETTQDVTQQVADVTSRVASAQAAIRQLRQLLVRAGNVGQLLSVQDEINSQESQLESLIAQQQALSHETTYATVNLTLVGHHAAMPKKHKKKVSHGLVAGLRTGWRGLKIVVVWLLTALGTLLPFAVPIVAVGGIIYVGRRRIARRRAAPATAPPAAAS
ncbi:MAG TPA: DUF4349 domain-containing protein [Streptosporangiaceae bacterium]|nr:DUF4349 domain-containing protein [Streptosporangiaceae bacterium]